MDSGFQYFLVELGFWIPTFSGIPDSLKAVFWISRPKIPDSISKIFPESGFPYMGGINDKTVGSMIS